MKTTKKKATRAKKQPKSARTTKTDVVLEMIRVGKTPADLCAATEWQAHTLRGFISATLPKKLGRTIRLVDGKYSISKEGRLNNNSLAGTTGGPVT